MTITAQNRQMLGLKQQIWSLQDELDSLYEKTKDFSTAARLAPERVRELFADIIGRRREMVEQNQSKWSIKRSGYDVR